MSDAKDSGLPGFDGERVVRVSVEVEDVSPFSWMRGQSVFPRTFWSGREDGTEAAAVGAADIRAGEGRDGSATLDKKLSPLLRDAQRDVRYYGGLRFDAEDGPGEEWDAFGPYRFVLPRFEMVCEDEETSLACNIVLPRDVEKKEEIIAEIEALSLPERDESFMLPRLAGRTDSPGFEGWRRNIEKALAAFEGGGIDKVVLARRADFAFEEALDAPLLAEALREATPGCFHFYVELEEGVAFVGASPERLYRREGAAIKSEAVAGTRPRGDSDADDEDLRDDLLGSEKDRAEHGYVRVGIEENLRPLCDALTVEESASEMKGASRRHLVSKVRGTLGEDVSDADVLAALHPTPAVGGYPKAKAMSEIRRMEPFDRGWYAGPIGWIGAEGAEFAVGIRSGMVRGKKLSLYSGAGIVAGSTPEGEWAEIEQKISDFAAVLGLDHEHAAK
ncbi:MAG: isochorismate synthase [Rubrobacter sp.]|nr:isochorismate synthase [Rubrobacter sp.]